MNYPFLFPIASLFLFPLPLSTSSTPLAQLGAVLPDLALNKHYAYLPLNYPQVSLESYTCLSSDSIETLS